MNATVLTLITLVSTFARTPKMRVWELYECQFEGESSGNEKNGTAGSYFRYKKISWFESYIYLAAWLNAPIWQS